MSRAARNEFFNEFAAPFQVQFTTTTSGNTTSSLLSPAAGKHLRIYKVAIQGPSGLSATQPVEVRDNGAAISKFYMPADGVRELDFMGRYYQMVDHLTLHQGTTQEPLEITVFYREKNN